MKFIYQIRVYLGRCTKLMGFVQAEDAAWAEKHAEYLIKQQGLWEDGMEIISELCVSKPIDIFYRV